MLSPCKSVKNPIDYMSTVCVNLFADRNECLLSHYCMHRCVNTAGSYYCECNDGYQLASNNHSCIGELKTRPAFLICTALLTCVCVSVYVCE